MLAHIIQHKLCTRRPVDRGRLCSDLNKQRLNYSDVFSELANNAHTVRGYTKA